MKAAEEANIPYRQILEGDVLELGGASITILRCPEKWGANARGATSRIQFGDARILSPGDIDNKTMKWYAENYLPSQLDCDILKIPHHGLATVPEEFLAFTSPDMLIVPNTYKKLYDGKRVFINWTRNTFVGDVCLYSGDGAVVCVTDGTDWYTWQEPNWTKK